MADYIAGIPVEGYVRQLRQAAPRAIDAATTANAAAVYFKYDMDNRWEGAFFICKTYAVKEARDDGWATDWE